MRISDWSSDVCSSDLCRVELRIEYLRALHLAVGVDVHGSDHGFAQRRKPLAPLFEQRLGDLVQRRVEKATGQHAAVAKMRGAQYRSVVPGNRLLMAAQAPECQRVGLGQPARDRKSTRLNSSPYCASRMPSSAFTTTHNNT